MRLIYYRYEEIKKIVVNFFERYRINCTPISGFEIALRMNIKVIPYSAYPMATRILMEKESEDGFSIKKGKQWYIYYNDLKPYPYDRINFTIMHEIGHILLNHKEESQIAELEANFFTKFALAPPVLIHKYNLKNVFEVSSRFAISYEAARYAFSYYEKWLNYGGEYYTDYEVRLCEIFGIA